MTYVKWVLRGGFWLLVVAVLHYNLPQTDIARITDTYSKRIDFGENTFFWGAADVGTDGTARNRDVFFIQARLASGRVMVYRNEDTGWGWPPYFKFNTANLQAEAADLRSTEAQPIWVVVRHYGWRNEFLTIFPNAIGVRRVEGPDATSIPWLNIVILTVLFATYWAIRVRWMRFWRARVSPVLSDIGDGAEAAGDSLGETRGRIRRWFRRGG